jgi:iron(III) transport system permease protein
VFTQLAANTFVLAVVTAAIAVILAVVLGYGLRVAPTALGRAATRAAVLGYAVPGAVIAVGVLAVFGALDRLLGEWLQATWGVSAGLLLSGTITGLVLAYLVRFLAAAFNTTEASLTKIPPGLDEASRVLGHGLGSTLWRVHLPLLRGGLLTVKFDTLAVRVYRLAADERLAEASTAALAIVLVGLLPVIVLSLAISRSRHRAMSNE